MVLVVSDQLCKLCCGVAVMGIKGRRVHMIEELSDTIISFQRGMNAPALMPDGCLAWCGGFFLYSAHSFMLFFTHVTDMTIGTRERQNM